MRLILSRGRSGGRKIRPWERAPAGSLKTSRRAVFDALVCLSLLGAAAGLLAYPQETVAAARSGLDLCLNVIIPSLFPFFVISTLIVQLGYASRFGRLLEPVMRPVFNVGGACSAAFVLGFIGGYPVGAKTVMALYESGSCTKPEAERLLSFCNNSGPAFIFGVVGAGVFSSSLIGLALYLVHTLASVCVGVLFRGWSGPPEERAEAKSPPSAPRRFLPAFIDSVKGSFQGVLNICGFVVFFTVLIRLLFLSGVMNLVSSAAGGLLAPLGFDEAWAERLFTGLIELTSGVWSLKGASSELPRSMAMAAFMLGWAGLSVHCQVLSFIGDSGLSVWTYICGKILQGGISAVLAYLVSRLFVFEEPASAYLALQIKGLASADFASAAAMSCLSAALLFLLFALFAKGLSRRKKRPRHKP